MTDKRDLDSLQREHTRLLEKHQHIDEKSHDIDALLRAINRSVKWNSIVSFLWFDLFSSNLPNDSLQRLREELEHLKERFAESITELDTRTTFIKKTIKVSS